MKKVILLSALIFPIYSLAEVSFISSGVGHYCYQEYSDAINEAQINADMNAKNLCGEVAAWRVSEFQILDAGNYCSVKVQAKYICQ